jgi:hypothetical protein
MFFGTDSTSVHEIVSKNFTLEKHETGRLTTSRQLNEVQFLALFGPRAVGWYKGIHEGFDIGTPPLRQCIPNLPFIVDTFSRELTPYRGQSFIESLLESFDFIVFRLEIVPRTTRLVKEVGNRDVDAYSLKKALAI